MTSLLASLGWDEAYLATLRRARGGSLLDDPTLAPGRVTRADRGVCTVLTEGGADRATLGGGLLSAGAKDPVALPCAGDWVVLRRWPDDRTTVEMVLPRRSAIVRRTADKDSTGQLLAANVDTAAVVEAMDSGPDLARVERFLALAWDSGASPLVVLTKCDLAADPQALVDEVRLIAPGVPVLAVSAEFGTGLDELRPLIAPGRTLGLIGRSGAGKSTLVNALAGVPVMGTQQVRRADGKGRHTTTYRALIPIPGGGAVLDTPGVRGVGLLDGSEGLDSTFSDVAAFAAACRFDDCTHSGEPGCAVLEALAAGDLPRRRWESYTKLQREIAFEARRMESRLRNTERAANKRPPLTRHARRERP
jgi:ribosome biogenesis GTPase / thiamine phosphate phosphatase